MDKTFTSTNTSLLDSIKSIEDLRKLPKGELEKLCAEVRAYLIDIVSKTAGHLASGLGTVELTVALHYVFNTPHDKIIWDVGHQAYPHKILTGHKEELKTIRKKNGLHAFIWRNETPFDVLSTGHASTSIGSALGLALANRTLGIQDKVIAVIGDGSLTGGCAFEALNHAGDFKDLNLLVILNDNEMSISENVGSLANSLAKILANPHYTKLVEGGQKILKKVPALHDFAMRAQEHFKGMVMPGTIFEEFGFNYIGPIDGHDLKGLISILNNIKNLSGLQFLHVVTKKGKGYIPAENNPSCYHGVPCFNPEEGVLEIPKPTDMSFSKVFGSWICDMAKTDKNLCGITPAMCIGSAMQDFAANYKDRFYDVGIAEQHAMVLASGLAAGNMHPVVAIYSTFLQRAYDGVIHDMAIQNLPILLCVDRGGVVGPDGPTHQGSFDIAYLKAIPNLVIMTPSNRTDMYLMLNTGYKLNAPAIVRYARSDGSDDILDSITTDSTLEIGKSKTILEGQKVAILFFGPFLDMLSSYCKEHNYTLIDMRFIKPFDKDVLDKIASTYEVIITVEDGVVNGGIGQSICAYLHNISKAKIFNLGHQDAFIMEGTRAELLYDQGISIDNISKIIATNL